MNQTSHSYGQPTPMIPGVHRKAVNIIAMGSSRNEFFQGRLQEVRPPELKDAETWTINYMGAIMPCDRVIHVDPVHPYLGGDVIKEMCDLALKNNTPFYTSHPHPKYPNHVIYPYDRVSQAFGGTSYFNSSVAYALALAVADGFNEIGMFGCDFSYPNLHQAESGRACVEFLMGVASQRGVRFYTSRTTTLLDMHNGQAPYGWFADPNLPPVAGGRLMTHEEIKAHLARHRNPPPPRDILQMVSTPDPIVTWPLTADGVKNDSGADHVSGPSS